MLHMFNRKIQHQKLFERRDYQNGQPLPTESHTSRLRRSCFPLKDRCATFKMVILLADTLKVIGAVFLETVLTHMYKQRASEAQTIATIRQRIPVGSFRIGDKR